MPHFIIFLGEHDRLSFKSTAARALESCAQSGTMLVFHEMPKRQPKISETVKVVVITSNYRKLPLWLRKQPNGSVSEFFDLPF